MAVFNPYWRSYRSFIRFLLVGVVNTAVGLSMTLILLNVVNFSYWYATIIGNVIGMFVSYRLNRSFTFGSNVAHAKSIIRFIVVVVCSFFISYTCGKFIAQYANTIWIMFPSPYIDESAVLFGNGLYTILNYLGQKHFVFNNK